MKFRLLSLFAAAVIVSQAYAAQWTIDPSHTTVQFSVKHMKVSTVRGWFNTFTGSAQYDPQNPSSLAFEATIDAASIDTRNEKRDGHLRSADFFDVANHPQVTFKSKHTQVVSPGVFKVTGDLTMRGVTREVTLDVTGFTETVKSSNGTVKTGATATGRINRKDWGLNWNMVLEAGGLTVSEEVDIELDVELNQVAEGK